MAKMKLPNGFGNVYKMKGNYRKPFRVRANVGKDEKGKTLWFPVGYFKTYNEGYKALVKYHDDPTARNGDITLGEIWERVQEKVFPIYSKATVRNYTTAYNLNFLELQDVHIKDIKMAELEDIFFMKTDGTQKIMKSVASIIFSYAMRHEYIIKNYADLLDLKIIPKAKTKEQERRAFTKKEYAQIISDLNEGNKMAKYAMFYLHTGIRREELSKVEVINDKHMVVNGTKNANAKNRKVPIHEVLKPFINELDFNISTQQISDYLNGVGQMIHNCRHSFITQSRRLYLSDIHVKKITGHGSVDITDRYTHFDFEDLEPIMEAFHY